MRKTRKIFTGSICISLVMHVMGLLFFQKYSHWLVAPEKKECGASSFALLDKDLVLKEAFVAAEQPPKKVCEPEIDQPFEFHLHTNAHYEPHFQITFPEKKAHLSFSCLEFKHVLPIFNLLEYIPTNFSPPSTSTLTATANPMASSFSMNSKLKAPTTMFSENPKTAFSEKPVLEKALFSGSYSHFPKLPTLEELDTTSLSDSFDADVVFFPKEKGYIFAITLIPKPNLELPKLKQNFLFLIDKANCIQQGRLNATKAAVQRAVSELSDDDTFNIIAFDSKLEKMSPHPLMPNQKSIDATEAFLSNLQLGSFFSSSDIYKPLFLTVPRQVEPDEIYTAILITDGEAFSKKQAYQLLLSDWTHYNGGKVSLYTIGLTQDSHLSALDAISQLNRGKLIRSTSFRGMKRRLLKLIKTIETPIGKSIHCKAISKNNNPQIQLFPKSEQTSHLFLDQPYTILGEADTLDDFVLFVQGRIKNRWLNIKKTISFVNAKKGSKNLAAEIAQLHAYDLYEQYLIDENSEHIAEMHELLAPFEIQPIFR